MTGSTLQLHSEGDENTYLTKNPQISFFKNYNTLIYDLPGHGKTPLNKTNLKFEDYLKRNFQ